VTKSNKTVTNPHLPVDGRGTIQLLRKEAVGNVAQTFAPQVTVRFQAKKQRSRSIKPQPENHANESHAITQQAYTNRILVPQSIEAFRAHLRGGDLASYHNCARGGRAKHLPLGQSGLQDRGNGSDDG
jgi:hypothetical protein